MSEKKEKHSKIKSNDSVTAPMGIPSTLQGTQPSNPTHGPQNAEHELRKAYNDVIQAELVQQFTRRFSHQSAGEGELPTNALIHIYKHAFRKYRDQRLLSAERWAHTVRHLAKAL